jgi:hypothetical protein
MRVHPLHRRIRFVIPVLSAAALLVVCCSGSTAVAAVSSSRTRQRHHVRSRRCGRHVHGLGVGQLNVGQVQEPARWRHVECSQDLVTDSVAPT